MCAFPRKLSLARGGVLLAITFFVTPCAQLGNILVFIIFYAVDVVTASLF